MTAESLGQAAVVIAYRGALEYLKAHKIDADEEALAATVKAQTKANILEALADARRAIDANMADAAVQTFQASMILAGIAAAKQLQLEGRATV